MSYDRQHCDDKLTAFPHRRALSNSFALLLHCGVRTSLGAPAQSHGPGHKCTALISVSQFAMHSSPDMYFIKTKLQF